MKTKHILILFLSFCFSINVFAQTVYFIGSGTSTSTSMDITPYGTYYHDDKSQFLILASELTGLGAGAGDISAFAFRVGTAQTQTMNGFTIKIGNTALSSLPAGNFEDNTGYTTCYSGNHVAATGWDAITFSANFAWDGTSNIIIEVCFDNSSYSSSSSIYYHSTTFTSQIYGYEDSGSGCSQTYSAFSNKGANSNRPNMAIEITPITCTGPSTLSANNFTTTTADLSWTENGSASAWDIEYEVSPFTFSGTPNVDNTATNPHTLTGLSPATNYQYKVRSDCGSLQSNWIGPFSFTTSSCNIQDPISLNASSITNSSASLSWTENGNSTMWDIEYNTTGTFTGIPTVDNTTNNPYTITGLLSGTTYYYQVRAECGGSNSAWVNGGSFTSLACVAPSGLSVSNIAGSSADISWTENGTATTWDIEYNTSGSFTGSPTINNTTSNPHSLSGLSTSTTYYYQVRSQCGVSTSGWVYGGSFTTLNTIVMSSTTISACGGTYQDPGGSGDYPANTDITQTIAPTSLGNYVVLTFTSFDVETHSTCGYDYVEIYDGPGTNYPLLGKFCGISNPGPFTASTIADGSLTVVFHSDGGTEAAGWEATISCTTTPPPPPGGDLWINPTDLGTLTCPGSPYYGQGCTTGRTSDCGLGAEDVFYKFTINETADVTISLCDAYTDFDTKIYLYDNAATCATATELYSNDDGPVGCAPASELSIVGLSAGTYMILIEGYSFADGNYKMTVTVSGCANMTYVSSTVTQNNTIIVDQGSTNQEIIGVEIVTGGGSSNPIDLLGLRVLTDGTDNWSTDLTGSVKVYYTGSNPIFSILGGSVGFSTPAAPGSGIDITLTTPQTLQTLGTSYFWITFDIDPAATIGNYVDAECPLIQMNGGGGIQTPTNNPPAGARQIQNIPTPISPWDNLDFEIRNGSCPAILGEIVKCDGMSQCQITCDYYNTNSPCSFTHGCDDPPASSGGAYIGMFCSRYLSTSNVTAEKANIELTTPLVVGGQYEISIDIWLESGTGTCGSYGPMDDDFDYGIYFLNSSSPWPYCTWPATGHPLSEHPTPHVKINGSDLTVGKWTTHYMTYTADQAYDRMMIGWFPNPSAILPGSSSSYAYVDNICFNAPGNGCAAVTLPVKIKSFSVNCENKNVVCEWTTESEKNNDYFSIERSKDALNWEEIAKIKGAGNSNAELSYTYTDINVQREKYYYRLKQTDFDGRYEYSGLKYAVCDYYEVNDCKLYPNPVDNELTVYFNKNLETVVNYDIIDCLGRIVISGKLNKNEQFFNIDLTQLNSGLYMMSIYNDFKKFNKTLIKK